MQEALTRKNRMTVDGRDEFGQPTKFMMVKNIFRTSFGDNTVKVRADDDAELRRYTIGSDRITVLHGTNPHRTKYDDFNSAMGVVKDEFEPTNIMKMGLLAESLFRKRTAEMSEYLGLYSNTKVIECPTLYRDCEWFTARSTPDGYIRDNPSVVFEYKLRWWSDEDLYGEPMTDQVRPSEFDQCQWHLFVTGATTCFLGVWFHPASDLKWFHIVRDDKHIEKLVNTADEYTRNCLMTGLPPATDASDGCKAYMQRLQERENSRRPFTSDEWAWALEYDEIKKRTDADDKRKQELGNLIRESMGEMQELYVEGGKSKATCKKPKNRDTRSLRVTVKD